MTPIGRHSRDAAVAHRAATQALAGFRAVPPAVREELAQEAALRTWQASAVRRPAQYASLVARRLAIDWLRRRLDRASAEVAEVPEGTSWQGRVEARMALRVVATLIAGAPELHRETLRLLYLEELSLEEVLEARLREVPGTDRARERDLLYKRRTRALSWIRTTLAAA